MCERRGGNREVQIPDQLILPPEHGTEPTKLLNRQMGDPTSGIHPKNVWSADRA
jgi:hypothetical protein